MNITVFITHPEVSCWNFSGTNYKHMQQELPGTTIKVCSSSEEFCDQLPRTQVACVWYFKEEWLALAPRLEWIITPAAGKDYFHIPPSSGIDVGYCSFHGELMGETVAGMILAHVRGIRDTVLLWENRVWSRDHLSKRMRSLRGSHIVILGFGHIGNWIGTLVKPFGVRITGVKRNLINPPLYFDKNDSIISIEDMDSVLPLADHLILALPGGEETTDIIDEKRIALLPAHAVIYNVGRGNAICEPALIQALKKGKIEAAYLDVIKKEPLSSGSPLKDCPNLFIMPHASAISPNYLDLFIQEFAEKYRNRYG
ncbi:MAG: hydroxyacid dehydrogenase [Spirochaetales bacterium]|nr:hydroxyacid dehydrogenase [Spirochaetales bacterium]